MQKREHTRNEGKQYWRLQQKARTKKRKYVETKLKTQGT
jgi:hypothetical protein